MNPVVLSGARGGAAGPTVFASDAFTDTNGTTLQSHTPTGGGTWTKHPAATSDASIHNNMVHNDNSGNAGLYYHSGTPAAADYDVEADVVMKSDNNVSTAGVCGRVHATNQDLYMARYTTNGNNWQLFKAVGGTFTQLGSNFGQTLTVDQAYRVKLEMRGTAIKLYVDGVERASATDSAVTATGKAGLRVQQAATSAVGLQLDNFAATDA